MENPYEEEVELESRGIMGHTKGTTTLTELRSMGGVEAAFADDHNYQQIEVTSTNIGFVRRLRKNYKK